ncbi:hypothetical protein Tco_1134393 [Tanacetum coccineum]
MVNDSCKDSFKRFTNEPALVCLPSPEDVNNKKEKQEVKNLAEPTAKRQTRIIPCLKNFRIICKESIFHSNKTPQVSSVFAITSTLPSIEPKDSLIMGDGHFSTFSAEEIVPIPRESKDTSRSESENVLPSCDDLSSFNVPHDDSVTFSNPLFEFDVNFNSSDINPLFDEMLEDIECKDSYPNLVESTFLVTPLSDSNKDECLTPGDDIEFLLHHDPSTPLKSVASILDGFINDPPFKENDDLFDLTYKMNDWKRILYDAPINEAECFDPGGDNDEIKAFLAIEFPTYIEEGYYDSEGDVLYLESLLSDDTTHNLSPDVFFDHEPQHIENELDHVTFSPKSVPLHHKFAGSIIIIPLRIDREHEDYISRMTLLCSNSSSRLPENSHTIIESLPTSTTLIEDSDSNREEIDIFSGPDDSIPLGIESDFDSKILVERIMLGEGVMDDGGTDEGQDYEFLDMMLTHRSIITWGHKVLLSYDNRHVIRLLDVIFRSSSRSSMWISVGVLGGLSRYSTESINLPFEVGWSAGVMHYNNSGGVCWLDNWGTGGTDNANITRKRSKTEQNRARDGKECKR